jgi:hypothetical protein
VPQVPQLRLSLVVLVQLPLHRVGKKLGHAQTPLWQV